ncbi:MAG: ion transporter [Gammaproteobacteria bacterium AqS3]|nr:ion transporter [Gammaproteobacteria bacterium AqS3]
MSSTAFWHQVVDKSRELTLSRGFQNGILILICISAAIPGIETSKTAVEAFGPWLHIVDRIILVIFVFELVIRITAIGKIFFRQPGADSWLMFDLSIVVIALIANELLMLRALRVLQALRIASRITPLRNVVSALLSSIPGFSSVLVILLLVFYVSGVMTTHLFGPTFPDLFGDLGKSLISLFQVIIFDGWSAEVVRPVMHAHPWAWAFFLPFTLITAFTLLNFFVAIVVNAMQHNYFEADAQQEAREFKAARDERAALMREIRTLRSDMNALTERAREQERREQDRDKGSG